MSVYERESRATDLVGMTTGLGDAIKAWVDEMGLAAVLAETVAACETASARHGAHGIFGRMSHLPKKVATAALLTPAWLIWATAADDREPAVIGVRLADFQILDYMTTSEYKLMLDDGLQINGHIGSSPEISTVFLGLGEDPDGRAFKQKVLEVWRAAREGAD
jgi:hypothetical protein